MLSNHMNITVSPVENEILLSQEVDLDVLVFVERYVTNLLKWDLLSFFGNNPHVSKTAQELANYIGRNDRAIRSELGDLTFLGLLQKSQGTETPRYTLTNNLVLRTQIIQFAQTHRQLEQ